MVHGESQLWVFAVVSPFHFLYGKHAHAAAIAYPGFQAAEVFCMKCASGADFYNCHQVVMKSGKAPLFGLSRFGTPVD
jgi:hypothetical protein